MIKTEEVLLSLLAVFFHVGLIGIKSSTTNMELSFISCSFRLGLLTDGSLTNIYLRLLVISENRPNFAHQNSIVVSIPPDL